MLLFADLWENILAGIYFVVIIFLLVTSGISIFIDGTHASKAEDRIGEGEGVDKGLR